MELNGWSLGKRDCLSSGIIQRESEREREIERKTDRERELCVGGWLRKSPL